MLLSKLAAAKKAVAYYRHSAEDKQENSVPIQREHAQNFAAKNNIEIIHEEADEGVSGLIANRPGFKRLFNDWVQNPQSPQFDYVLFYDISRWGRFQDQNEGAHYAFICKKNGKTLVNVSRGFPQEGQQLTNSLIDSIDRFMAAEYSRVLSEKVWYGCMKVSRDGYSAGGTSCYGMARLLLDESKKPIGILKKGEHKLISNQRVTFTPLNDETTQTVKEIFDLFVNHWKTPKEIADILNVKRIPSASGGLWNRGKVVHILSNETYSGTRIYNKTWGRLKQKKADNPRSQWVVTPHAFDSVVSPDIFWQAQEQLFWSMPAKWKKGIYTINRVRKTVSKEIRELLLKKDLSDDTINNILEKIPITYSVRFYADEIPYRCFVIDEQMYNFDKVIAVSIALYERDPIDKVFLIPTADFNQSNFLVFGEADECSQRYTINREQVAEYILPFIQKLIPAKLPVAQPVQ